jgi:heme/copper-type cytochrome/quinol oxidase subunit 2
MELFWAVVPAVALAVLLVFTWSAVQKPASAAPSTVVEASR